MKSKRLAEGVTVMKGNGRRLYREKGDYLNQDGRFFNVLWQHQVWSSRCILKEEIYLLSNIEDGRAASIKLKSSTSSLDDLIHFF